MYGLVAPKGTPRELVQRLGREVAVVVQMPEVKEAFYQQGAEAVVLPAEELGAKIRSEVANWSKVIKAVGIKPE